MRKTFLFTIALFTSLFLSAQTEIFHEHFADSTGVSDIGWTAIDNDGDGNNWVMNVFESEIYMASASWDGSSALTPENYLISPAIDLTGFDTVRVEYFVATATTSTYYNEHYKFVVADAADVTSVEAGDILLEETMTAASADGNWQQRDLNLTDYIDQTIHLAWVHFDCSDQYKLLMDSVTVYVPEAGSVSGVNKASFTFFPNPASDELTVRYAGNSQAVAEIYSVNGQLIRRSEAIQNGQLIHVSDLPQGYYILKIQNDSGVMARKFVVQR